VAAVVEDKTAELAVHENAKNRRRAVDKMAPRRDKTSVDVEKVGTRGDAADSSGAMEARDVATAARDRKGSAETVKTGKAVSSTGAGAGE